MKQGNYLPAETSISHKPSMPLDAAAQGTSSLAFATSRTTR